MLKLAALALLAAASASASAQNLVSDSSWWEKITVVVTDDGDPQSCTYESSRGTAPTDGCVVAGGNATMNTAAATQDEYTRITFERRFTPGDSKPQAHDLHPGDTLLGGHIMALAIDGEGKVSGCKILARSGDMTPDYGCDEAGKETFETAAANASGPQVGFMTVIVYGHEEHVA